MIKVKKVCGICNQPVAGPGTNFCLTHFKEQHGISYKDAVDHTFTGPTTLLEPDEREMVNHPPHYTRGPRISIEPYTTRILECIEVIRHIKDMRLATAMKYIWRVAFGGKDNDREDIKKAMWYLQDWLDNPLS